MSRNQKLFSVAILVGLLVVGFGWYWIHATFFEAGGWAVTSNEDVDKAYRLNVKGDDLRVYEFTPQGEPNTLCVVTRGELNMDMECFPKQ